MAETRKQRNDIVQMYSSKKGYKSKIAAKCVDCIYDETQSGTWRQQVEECAVLSCPLWDVRPTRIKKENDEDDLPE